MHRGLFLRIADATVRPMAPRRRVLLAAVPIAVVAIVAAVVHTRPLAITGAPPETSAEEAETEPEREGPEGPGPETETAEEPEAPAAQPSSSAGRGAESPEDTAPPHASTAPRRPRHTADPCTVVPEIEVPESFEETTALGVTVAWPKEQLPALEATVLAHLAAGLLEEAASITGTARRPELTVIVYPTTADFHEKGGAPSWASGLYDGAVKLPARPGRDFGIVTRSLRHEVMHAQLHAAAGCMPVWLDEGAASYFGGRPPKDTWIGMLRRRQILEPSALEASTVEEVKGGSLDIVYAQSVAMVLFAIDRSSDESLRDTVRELRARKIDRLSRAGLRLWSDLYSDVDARSLGAWLGVRLFGMRPGPGLEAALAGGVCCQNERTIRDVTCYGAPAPPGARFWIDDSRSPPGMCSTE